MPETPYIRDPFNEPLKIEYLKNKQNEENKASRMKYNNIKSIIRNHVNTPFDNIYNEYDIEYKEYRIEGYEKELI